MDSNVTSCVINANPSLDGVSLTNTEELREDLCGHHGKVGESSGLLDFSDASQN